MEAKYFRKGKTIRGPEGDETFEFFAQAKRRSREIQLKEQGAIGRGVLKLVNKLPKRS